eukprot:834421-Rhodomonas_salina.1
MRNLRLADIRTASQYHWPDSIAISRHEEFYQLIVTDSVSPSATVRQSAASLPAAEQTGNARAQQEQLREDDFCRRSDADWLVHERYNNYVGTGDNEDDAGAEPTYDERDDDRIEDDDFDDHDDPEPPQTSRVEDV